MTTTNTKFAEYTITEHTGYVEVDVKYPSEAVNTFSTFKVFDSFEEANEWIAHNEKVNRIMKIFDSYTRDMEHYSYYGSNPGVPEDEYEDIAEEIIKEFDIKG
jgi:antibiotic biosynthesis monooxygenase (ABM) superfamily enzyme